MPAAAKWSSACTPSAGCRTRLFDVQIAAGLVGHRISGRLRHPDVRRSSASRRRSTRPAPTGGAARFPSGRSSMPWTTPCTCIRSATGSRRDWSELGPLDLAGRRNGRLAGRLCRTVAARTLAADFGQCGPGRPQPGHRPRVVEMARRRGPAARSARPPRAPRRPDRRVGPRGRRPTSNASAPCGAWSGATCCGGWASWPPPSSGPWRCPRSSVRRGRRASRRRSFPCWASSSLPPWAASAGRPNWRRTWSAGPTTSASCWPIAPIRRKARRPPPAAVGPRLAGGVRRPLVRGPLGRQGGHPRRRSAVGTPAAVRGVTAGQPGAIGPQTNETHAEAVE